MESNPREKVAQSETWRHKRHPSDATMTKLSVTIKLENTVVFFHWTCTKNTPLTKTLTVYVLKCIKSVQDRYDVGTGFGQMSATEHRTCSAHAIIDRTNHSIIVPLAIDM